MYISSAQVKKFSHVIRRRVMNTIEGGAIFFFLTLRKSCTPTVKRTTLVLTIVSFKMKKKVDRLLKKILRSSTFLFNLQNVFEKS